MKTFFAVFLFIFHILMTVAVSADSHHKEEAAFQSFQPIVQNFRVFFEQHPRFLVKVSPPQSRQLTAYSVAHFFMKKIAYDILKTQSIVTPFIAHIDIDTEVFDNKPCGDVTFNRRDRDGWADIKAAIRTADNKACFVSRTVESGPIQHRFNFQYYVRENKWMMTTITYPDGNINGRFMALLGVVSPWFPLMNEPEALSFNKKWIAFFMNQIDVKRDTSQKQ